MAGSVTLEMRDSRRVHLLDAWRRWRWRFHAVPITTSMARVRAKRVRSRVRPARGVWVVVPSRLVVVVVKEEVGLDWRMARER